MSVVLDASACMAWFLPDEKSEKGEALRDIVIADGAVTSFMWPIEMLNVFAVSVRRHRLDRERADECAALVARFEIEIEQRDRAVLLDAYALATELTISAYDATYLEIARRRKLPLATLDARLSAAAERVGVKTIA